MSVPDNIIQSRASGYKVKIVSTETVRGSLAFSISNKLVKPGTDPSDAVKSLKGKTIGINSQGTQMQLFASAVLEEYGVKPSEVKFVGLGTPTAMVAAFRKGKVDASVFDSQYSEIVSALDIGATYSDMRYPLGPDNKTPMPKSIAKLSGLANSWAFTDSYLKKSPDAAIAWRKAISEATKYAKDKSNRDELYKIEKEVGRVSIPDGTPNAEKIYRNAIDAAAEASNTSGKVDQSVMENWLKFMSKMRNIKKLPTVSELIWTEN